MVAVDKVIEDEGGRFLNVLRCGLTGAVSLSVGFAFYWAVSLMNMTGASHFYLALFSPAAGFTLGSLGLGLVCSSLTGLAIGVLIAVTYNGFAFLEK